MTESLMAECDSEPSRARLWVNAHLATMATGTAGLGVIDDGAILSFDGRIVHAGFAADVPTSMDAERIDCGGRWVTPGLIDCHTHLVFGGDRSDDFQRRLRGESYESIARSGGGIASTVRATRAADFSSLVEGALPRLDALMAEGVTTVEVKSGYGLEAETELRQLRAARELGRRRPVTVFSTFLGAHGMPPEASSREGYLDALISDILPRVVAGELADAADAFCETIAFSPREVSRFFDAARAAGLPVRLHADQLSDLGGATLAAAHGALSADHLEHSTDKGAADMARAGTVAVLLPGAFYFLRETRVPPIEAFRQHGVRIAVATDCNPGTSPLTSLLLAMNMAATTMRLTVEECLLGVTREAARALGRLHDVGTLEPGKSCDLAIWNVGSLAELVYRMGFNPLHARIWRGR